MEIQRLGDGAHGSAGDSAGAADGLLLGRLQECELLLNHPAVSRAQAGIKLIKGSYFLFGLRPSNPVKLNGRAIEENEALAPGDVLEVGPFLLEVDLTDEALVLKVSLQIGTVVDVSNLSSPTLGTAKLEPVLAPGEKKPHAKTRATPIQGDKALDIFWDKRIREAGKMVRPSPLFPRSQRRAGKAAANWTPTTDLGNYRVRVVIKHSTLSTGRRHGLLAASVITAVWSWGRLEP